MAFDDYDDEDEYSSRGKSHERRDASDSGYRKTSDFSTMVSEDGRLFGFKLDPVIADRAKNVLPLLLTYLTDKGGDWATREWGPKYGKALGYAIALSEQIAQTSRDTYKASKSLNDIRLAVRPLSKEKGKFSSTSVLSGDNEVVANARGKMTGIYWQSLIETAVSTIGAMPALLVNYNKAKLRIHEHELNRKYEEAKGDPKKLAKILDEELTLGHNSLKGVNAQEMRAAMDEIIETRRTAYEAKFKEFKTANESTLKKEIEEILKELNPDNAIGHLAKLRRLGVNTEELSSQINSIRNYRRSSADERHKEIEAVIKSFAKYEPPKGKRSYSRNKPYIDDALRAKFVRQHGAFDSNDLDYLPREEQSQLRGNRDHPATERDRIEQQIRKMEEAHIKVEKEKESGKGEASDLKQILDFGWQLGAGIVREIATKAVGGKALEKYKQPIAFDRILHLRRTLEKAHDHPLEEVPAIANGGDKDMGYVRYVHEVFQQHQKDCSRPEVGERFFDHFDKARWNDAEIMKMSDEELNPYEFAIRTIAQRIKTGRMDAIALIELTGDKQRKIVHSDGRTFGPSATRDDEAAKKAIATLIDEKTATLHTGQKHTDEEVNEKLGNFVFSVADLKHALESKDMDAQQRAFIFTLFSDVVGSDEKLCAKLSISNARCQELRKESKEQFTAMLDGTVSVLAGIIENEPEKLDEHLKLTDKQKELILAVAGRAKEQGKLAGDVVENAKEREDVEAVVADSMMTLAKAPAEKGEDGKSHGFWQKVVAAARRSKQPKEKAEGYADGEERENPRKKSRPSRQPREEMDDSFNPDRAEDDGEFPGQEADKQSSHAKRLGGRKGFSPIERLGDKPSHDESGIRGV